jgi:hypothetical protein
LVATSVQPSASILRMTARLSIVDNYTSGAPLQGECASMRISGRAEVAALQPGGVARGQELGIVSP